MALTLRVHETRRIPGTTQTRLVRTLPYLRFSHQGESPVFAQDGQFYYEAVPDAIKDVPPWVQELVDRLTPLARLKVGIGTDDDLKVLKAERKKRRKARRSGRNSATSGRSLDDLELDGEEE